VPCSQFCNLSVVTISLFFGGVVRSAENFASVDRGLYCSSQCFRVHFGTLGVGKENQSALDNHSSAGFSESVPWSGFAQNHL
jgi:hypothetical protein